MPEEIRFGVIGCAQYGMQLCAGISNAPSASVTMLMDTRQAALDDLTEFYHVPTSTRAEDVVANPEVDAVLIAAPTHEHTALAQMAAQENKHVLIHGVLADSLAQANDLVEACENSDVKVGMTYLAQVDPAMRAARDLVRAGLLGDVISVRMTSLQNLEEIWPQARQEGGGALMGRLLEEINAVRWVTGLEVASVFAQYDTLASSADVDDTAAMLLRYENGAIGIAQAGLRTLGGAHEDADGPRVYTTKGQLILGSTPLIYREDAPEGSRPNAWQEIRYSGARGDLAGAVEGFAQAVLEDSQPPASAYDGLQVLRVALAAYASGHSGEQKKID